MAPANNASFIPKSPRPGIGRSRITKRIYVLSYISYVLFFSALIVVVAIYVYSSVISKQLEAGKKALTEQQQRFSQQQLAEVRELEKKMLLSLSLLDRSIAPSKLFDELEGVVSDDVAFTGATFKREQTTGEFTYEFSGVANDFNDVIYQRDILNRSQVLATAELATYDYSLDRGDGEEGGGSRNGPVISFTFSDTIAGAVIPYEPVLINNNATSTEVVGEPREGNSDDGADNTDQVNQDI